MMIDPRRATVAMVGLAAMLGLTSCATSRATSQAGKGQRTEGTVAAVDKQEGAPGQTGERPQATTASDTTESVATTTAGGKKQYPWMRPPAPIAGDWRVSRGPECHTVGNMVVRIAVEQTDPPTATGTVISVGDGARVGYRRGETVLRAKADDFGKWPGQVKWRSILGVERWDPVSFVGKDGGIAGTMVFDRCWYSMTRVR